MSVKKPAKRENRNIWGWLRDPENRAVLALAGGVIAAAWILYGWIFKEIITPRVQEQNTVQQLMNYVCGREVLLSNFSDFEMQAAVHSSVRDIRNQLLDTLQKLPAGSAAIEPIQSMQRATGKFMENPKNFRGPNGVASGPMVDAILKLRAVFSENASKLVKIYQLKDNCDLSAGLHLEPSNSAVTEPRN